jgi:hypothetical protein
MLSTTVLSTRWPYLFVFIGLCWTTPVLLPSEIPMFLVYGVMMLDLGNYSSMTTFLLLGFSVYPHLQIPSSSCSFPSLYLFWWKTWAYVLSKVSLSSFIYPCAFSSALFHLLILLFYCIYTKTVKDLICRRQNSLFWVMHDPICFWMHICDDRNVSVSIDFL